MLRRSVLIGLIASALAVSVSAQTYRQSPAATVLDAADEIATLDVSGMGTAAVDVSGSFTGTLTFEVGNSGGGYTAINCTPPNSTTPDTTTTSTGRWGGCNVAGWANFRVRMSAYSSGAANVVLSAAATGGGGGGGASVNVEDITVGAQPADAPHFVRCSDGSVAAACVVSATNLDVQIGGSDTVTVTATNLDVQSDGADLATATQAGAIQTAVQLIDNVVSVEDAVAGSAFSGVGFLAVRQDSHSDLAADGDFIPPTIDADGGLRVSIVAGAGSGGTAIADDADFTAGTTSFTPLGGFYQSGNATDCTDGDACTVGITAERTLKVTLFSAAGSELAPSADQTEDAPAAGAETGPMVLTVRRDTAATSAGTDGDFATLNTDANGRLYATTTVTAISAGDTDIGNVDLEFAGTAAATNNGTASAQTMRVTLASDSTGQVAPVAKTTGGCTPHSIISANTVNETAIKASAGQVYWLNVTNIGANEVFFKLYNDTAANIDETDTPVIRLVIPGNAAGAGNTASIPVGMAFSTAITYRITGGIADNDTTAIAANEVLVSGCFL